MISRSLASIGLFVLSLLVGGAHLARAAEAWCERSELSDLLTNDFYFSATNAEGAVGDVVAVEVFLTVDGSLLAEPFGLHFVASYDPRKLEGVGEPLFSEEYQLLTWFLGYAGWLKGEVGPRHIHGHHGFGLATNMDREAVADILVGGARIPLLTLFFRIVGEPGDTAEFRIADGEWAFPTESCVDNQLVVHVQGGLPLTRQLRSDRHRSGLIRIVPGEATHTEVPEVPPSAKVYPEAPTLETARILFELSGRVAQPGARGVPLELHATSSHEFCGFMFGLTFPAHLVKVAEVIEAVRPGSVWIDNEGGGVGALLWDSYRRIGREGERVHLATLLVDVSPDAGDGEIWFRFEQAGSYLNRLAIRHERGVVGSRILPVVGQVAPLRVNARALRVQSRTTVLGDVNLDYAVDVRDALALLEHLFLGAEPPVCEGACDANADGRVDIADPVAILQALGAGRGAGGGEGVWCEERS